jgi:hypothetical protein
MKRAILFVLLFIVVVVVAAALIIPLFIHGPDGNRQVGQAVGTALPLVGIFGFIYGWNTRKKEKQ